MIGAIIFAAIFGILISSLIITVILMPLLRLLAQAREGFGYTFNTVVWAQLIGTIINVGLEFVLSSMQDVDFGQSSASWFNLPVGILLLTYMINARHQAGVGRSLAAAVLVQVIVFLLLMGIVAALFAGAVASG